MRVRTIRELSRRSSGPISLRPAPAALRSPVTSFFPYGDVPDLGSSGIHHTPFEAFARSVADRRLTRFLDKE
jgi:hypothetical protein